MSSDWSWISATLSGFHARPIDSIPVVAHSLRYALVVLVGAPLSTVGGLLVLAITGIPLDVSSMTGLILLVGLVVKNGILLLEHLQGDLAQGAPFEAALVAAARRRLRPVLMTTAATVVGHFPLVLATGPGAGARNSIGIVLVSGMVIVQLKANLRRRPHPRTSVARRTPLNCQRAVG